MRILSIELVSYNRMKLNGFKSIKIDFTQPIQQILGSNGSGKSSIMSELNPLPAERGDFGPDGKKHIVYEHRGATYETISDFSKGNKHSLIKDGQYILEDVNGKIITQKVFELFKFNKQIRDLTVGRLKFTNMGPTERRQWFTMFPSVDFKFAIKSYNHFKERLRDINGVIKEQSRALVLETSKLLKDDEIKKLRNDVRQLHKEITELLEHRSVPSRDKDSVIRLFENTINEINTISNRLLYNQHDRPIYVDGLDSLEDIIHDNEKELAGIDSLLSSQNEQFNRLQEQVSLLEKSGTQGAGEITDRLEQISEKIGQLKSRKTLSLEVASPSAVLESLPDLLNQLETVLAVIPSNTERYYTQKTLNELRDKKQSITDHLSKLNNEIDKANVKIQHLNEHKEKGDTQCPACNHRWIIGFNETAFDNLQKFVQQASDTKNTIEKDLSLLDEKINEFIEYGANIRHYNLIKTNRSDIKCFWEDVDSKNFIIDTPSRIIEHLQCFGKDLELDIVIDQLDEEKKKLLDVLEVSKKINQSDSARVIANLDMVSKSISELTQKKILINKSLSGLISYREFLKDILDKKSRLDLLTDSYQDLHKEITEHIRFETIDAMLKQKQSQLAMKEDMLSEINNQKNRVLYLESQLASFETDKIALKLLVDKISPSGGLIAEGMLGFINHFITQVNIEIKTIWTYPLEVQSCSINEDGELDLDYKFPLLVRSESNIIEDVSYGSDAMREVVNFAFMITAMQYLDLGDYPVNLDEFSNSFDVAHRANAVESIKNILNYHRFTQLFLISHYFTLHGALSNAEVCVLNSDNLSITSVHNEHVTFG